MARAARPVSSSRRTAAGQSHARVTVIKTEPMQRYHEVRTFEGGTRTPTLNERLGLSPSPSRATRKPARLTFAELVDAEILRRKAEREE